MANQTFIDIVDPRLKNPVQFVNDYSVALVGMATAGYALGYGQALQDARSQWRFSIEINRLVHQNLLRPLHVIVEPDDHGYVAKTPDLPLYGYGEDSTEAIAMLQREIESLYDDLSEGNDFGDEWAYVKDFLAKIVVGR